MKKSTIAATMVIAVLSVGCAEKSGVKSPENAAHGNAVEGVYEIPVPDTMSRRSLSEAIINAGEAQGWMMTEMGRGAIVASKYIDGKSASVVIDTSRSPIEVTENRTTMSASRFSDEVNGLNEAIVKALKSQSGEH